MPDYSKMEAGDFYQFCRRNLIPLTFLVCNSCDKAFHPEEENTKKCLCGADKSVTEMRLPRTMLVTYIKSMQGVYQWK